MSRSTTITRVPARASRIAAARPLPMPSPAAPPPVTIATLSLSPQLSGTSSRALSMRDSITAISVASAERQPHHGDGMRGELVLEPVTTRRESALADVDRTRCLERVGRVDAGAVDFGDQHVVL